LKTLFLILALTSYACHVSSSDKVDESAREDQARAEVNHSQAAQNSDGTKTDDAEPKTNSEDSKKGQTENPGSPSTPAPAANSDLAQKISGAEAEFKKINEAARKYPAETVILERVKRMEDALAVLKMKQDAASKSAFCVSFSTIGTGLINSNIIQSDQDIIRQSIANLNLEGAICEDRVTR
jgi:hypothetical protein